MPKPGFHELRILSPTVLELSLVTTTPPDPPPQPRGKQSRNSGPGAKQAPTAPRPEWDFISTNGAVNVPRAEQFQVIAAGKPIPVSRVGFRRRALYAPLKERDLRIGNSLFLELAGSVPIGAKVEVKDAPSASWLKDRQFSTAADERRLSPVLHANQTGFLPAMSKKAFAGYYLGSLGELEIKNPSGEVAKFFVIATATGATNFEGVLRARPERGFTFNCYQRVYEMDFTDLKTPGEYQLFVPGLGCSYPFHVGDNVAGWFARTYALGLYHQRCGTNDVLPYTRFTHAPCHTAPAEVPTLTFTNTQYFLAQSSEDFKNSPCHTAPQLKDTSASLYPFVRTGTVDVSGGHHDAGDYSKYTVNSAGLIHNLITAVDAFAGVASLDNLGLPESGDGKSDVLQEAIWEADFIAKLQDDDGGFYFLVYPRDRRYENNVEPDAGDSQIVWPKTTAVTAAGVAALAQCSSSPTLKGQFPEKSAQYLAKARKGWAFLTNALERHGHDGAYQKITHYGHEFFHDDELAWAACELYLATGENSFHTHLSKWLNPADPRTRKWSWWRMYEGYGCAIRSYALAKIAGKVKPDQLDIGFLARCEQELIAWADELLQWSRDSAYGTSFPAPTKRVRSAGWYFSCDPAFDLATAAQLQYPAMKDPRANYREALLANLNYEAGCNPVNVSYITGLGWKRQREIVHQWAQNDRRVLPMSGIPLGNIQAGFGWLDHYKQQLGALSFPPDGAQDAPYPLYDRWGDSFNLSQEFVVLNQGRGLAVWSWLMAQTSLRTQPAKQTALQIEISRSGELIKARLKGAGADGMRGTWTVWEASGHEPAVAPELTVPSLPAVTWIEAEAQLMDGRLAFAVTNLATANPAPQAARK
ncbi:MAG: glycoside hydrolase family 9 protein [Verrucomicrobia subdivision 3 bacterium]|nr:glycoside hydrolase family 9 protein [Limisphaerales bacterium]